MNTKLKIKRPKYFNEFKFNYFIEKTKEFDQTVNLIFNIIKNSYNEEEKNLIELNYDRIVFDNNLLIMIKNDIKKLKQYKRNNGYIDNKVFNYLEITFCVLSYMALEKPYYMNAYDNNITNISRLKTIFKNRIDELISINNDIFNFNDMKNTLEL